MVLLSVQFVNCNAMKKILSILHILSIVSTILLDPLTKQKNRLSKRFFLHISKKNTNFAA